MPEIYSFPNNQDEYTGAEHIMRWHHGRTSGVFGAGNNANVAAVAGAMAVTVSDGLGWLSNNEGNGIVWWNQEEKNTGTKLALSVDMADGVLNRIDRVVVSWQTTNYVDRPTISILKGASSSSPVAPSLTNNSTMRQISLARISVPAGITSIAASLITDERMDGSVCGIVTDSVSVDTSMVNNQMQAILQNIKNELAGIIGGTGFDPAPIREENVTISASSFVGYAPENSEETKLYNMGYVYRAMISVQNVLSSMFPYVTLSVADVDASGAGIANQFASYDGGVFFYADAKPTSDITALTIECRKAVV